MCRYSRTTWGRDKTSAAIFVIAFALTCVGASDARAGETLEATGRKAIENAKVVVGEVQEKAQEFTINVILGGKDAIERVSTLGKWTSALATHTASPVKRGSEAATWGRERSSRPPVSGTTVHDGNLAIHQHFAQEIFLRFSVGMDEEAVFTGSGEAHPAVGLSLIRSFD
jgi:hypothetical protein